MKCSTCRVEVLRNICWLNLQVPVIWHIRPHNWKWYVIFQFRPQISWPNMEWICAWPGCNSNKFNSLYKKVFFMDFKEDTSFSSTIQKCSPVTPCIFVPTMNFDKFIPLVKVFGIILIWKMLLGKQGLSTVQGSLGAKEFEWLDMTFFYLCHNSQ